MTRSRAWLAAVSWAVLPVMLSVLVAFVALVAASLSATSERVATESLINVILVVGLYIFVGNSGIVSFGHVSFMALGAYGTAILTIPVAKKAFLLDLPGILESASAGPFISALLPAAGAGIVALVVGVPILRLSGLSAAIATFSLLLITFTIVNNWRSVTAGPSVLVGTPTFTTLSWALSWAVAAIFAAAAYQRSRFGLRLRCSREDEFAAKAIGVRVVRERVIAFSLSAMVVAIGGTVLAHERGAFDPKAFYLQATFMMIVMLVVGGLHSLSGAVLGALAVSGISEGLRRMEQGVTLWGGLTVPAIPNVRDLGLGLVLLVILLKRPGGIMGSREVSLIAWPGRANAPSGGSAAAQSAEK